MTDRTLSVAPVFSFIYSPTTPLSVELHAVVKKLVGHSRKTVGTDHLKSASKCLQLLVSINFAFSGPKTTGMP